ncbi:flavin reductase family protein [Ensifer sp. ENS05]|nr:flavin reductase family protein [Ensifer sp. ENS05]
MFYEPRLGNHGLPRDPILAIVAPRPIGWISTLSPDDVVNIAPYSYFNIFGRRPPIVGFSSNGRKHTIENVERSGQFVCNLATWDLMEAVNVTSDPIPPGESEMEHAGLKTAESLKVKPPRVLLSPCALECQWTETIQLKCSDDSFSDNFLVCGEVVGVHIDERYLVDGLLDVSAMRTLSRCGYLDYSSVESTISRPRSYISYDYRPKVGQGG